MPQPREARGGVSREGVAQQPFLRLLYHEAKMCACTNIFAKPSMPQPREARGGVSREGVLSSPSCGYYTMTFEKTQEMPKIFLLYCVSFVILYKIE